MKRYYVVLDDRLGIKVYLGKSVGFAAVKWEPGTVLGVGWTPQEAMNEAKVKAEAARRAANGDASEVGI